jgi:hypothetical protein
VIPNPAPLDGETQDHVDLGGYSLLTVNLFTRINRVFGLSLPIGLLFDAPTVRVQAEIIDRDQSLSVIVSIRPRAAWRLCSSFIPTFFTECCPGSSSRIA